VVLPLNLHGNIDNRAEQLRQHIRALFGDLIQ
jgi:hypothetical protein